MDEPTKNSRPLLTLDVARYEEYLKDCDLTEEQKQEFLQTLWNIIIMFVSAGFGVEPTQQACGELAEIAFENSPDSLNAIESKLTANFGEAR
jgi:hypothetical protein